MTLLTPLFSRINQIVFGFGIICLATILADTILVLFTVSAANPHFTQPNATSAPPFTISGQVTNNTIGLAGVTMTLSGFLNGVTTTDNNGNYSFDVVGGGDYTVVPSATGFTFNPPARTFNTLGAPRIADFAVSAQSFVVTNADDHGPGSLREALINANARAGTDPIIFNIPGLGVKVISLLTPLPEITDPVVIGADAQPGYAGAPLIELDGASAGSGANGLVITAGRTIVRGLAIGGFQAAGIVVRSGDGTGIQGNYIGVDATGALARPNNVGIQLSNSRNNLIGGTVAAARNVVSGNLSNGVEVGGNDNLVQGNFIGTNASGTAAIGNGASGIADSGANNLIGGTTPGSGNLISGNQTGVSGGSVIQGNLIGTDVTGTKKVSNHIGIQGNALIGGLTPGAGNVISGNSFIGVFIQGIGSKLQGNFIGTDITGTMDLGNDGDGVSSFADDALIGGIVPEARNVIAGNGGFGNIVLGVSPSRRGATVQGNYIGTDVTGTRALGRPGTGITILSNNNLIGGAVPGAQNVVSGNFVGIRIGDRFGGPGQGNVIQGNIIGLNAPGTRPLPNSNYGILFQEGSSDNIVGGTQSGAANKIAFNGIAGVNVSSGRRNSVRGNSIFSNGGLGIDLEFQGVTPNDSTDADVGANNLQNFPVITSVLSFINGTTIRGSLNSTPNTTFLIDFYSNAALDPSGNGEGAVFLNTTPVTTDSNGDAAVSVTLPVPLGTGRVLTATATDPDGNTSEFSAGDSVGINGNLQFSVGSIRVIEDVGVVNVTVLRKGGSSGTLTIDYATSEDTATAGQDYTSASGRLTFNEGETSKSLQIPITDDAVTEPDETFTVSLANSASLENLGTPNTLVVTIQDHSAVPIILQNDPSVAEGNTGTSREMLFTFSLSAVTGRSVSANYATSNLNATGGSSCSKPGIDYETTSGTISFAAGDTSTVTIPVKICGDTLAEGPENFRVNLSNLSNATADSSHGIGAIFDDDELELLLEESGPTINQAVAFDAVLFLRDPFPVAGIPEWFTSGPDRNTRVMFFVRNLPLNPDSPSTVAVELRTPNKFFTVPAEDVRSVPNVELTQVVIRLPDDLPAGVICTVNIRVEFQASHLNLSSNTGTIRIAP